MQQVLSTTTSAASTSSVGSIPSAASRPAMRSESCSFIWHPKVRTRNFLLTTLKDTGPVGDADPARSGGGEGGGRGVHDAVAQVHRDPGGGLDRPDPVLDEQAQGGAALPVDLHVDEGRHAHHVDAGGSQVAPGDGNGLYGLVEGAGPHHLYLDRTV